MIQLFRPSYDVDACLQEIREVLESGWAGTGPKCAKFEKQWGEYVQNPYTHYVSSATAALHIAMRLCDLPAGSKVVTTPITFCSTNAVILYENHVPVFADVDEHTLSLCCDSVIKNVLKHNAGAVIWVHYSGYATPQFEDFMKWRNEVRPELHVIEDCAHAAGAYYDTSTCVDGYSVAEVKRMVGSRRDTFSCNSFQAVKNLNTADSGSIQVPNAEYLERVKKLAWLGIDKSTYTRTGSTMGNELYKWKYNIEELGWKYNGNDVMAAIALVQFKCLEPDNKKRQANYYDYTVAFEKFGMKLIYQADNSSHHLCVTLVKNREKAIGALKDKGYAPGVHYLPNYEFPIFEKFYEPGSCPTSERIAEQILTLPNHLLMGTEHIEEIAEIIFESQKE